MKVENLVYPWMKDFQVLVEKIRTLENRVYYLEGLVPNQKPQQSYNTYTSNSAGVQINPGQAGAISGQAWAGVSSGVSGGSTLPMSSSGRKK